MSRPLRMLTVLAGLLAALLLASCSKPDNGYQGWIEANLIFVAPDEVGRVQTLSVRGATRSRPATRCSRSTTTCSAPTSTR